jgi:hypothetical protein
LQRINGGRNGHIADQGLNRRCRPNGQRSPEEETSVFDLYRNYIAILALLPAVRELLRFGGFSFSYGSQGIMHPTFAGGLYRAFVQYSAEPAGIFIVAFVISAIAPHFEGKTDDRRALLLTAYSYTPVWLASLFGLIPGLRWLDVLGFYGIYVFSVGLPTMMRAAQGKSRRLHPCDAVSRRRDRRAARLAGASHRAAAADLAPTVRGRFVLGFRADPVARRAVRAALLFPEGRAGFKKIHQKRRGGESVSAVARRRERQNDLFAWLDAAEAVNDGQSLQRPSFERFVGDATDLGLGHSGIMFEFQSLSAPSSSLAEAQEADERADVSPPARQ